MLGVILLLHLWDHEESCSVVLLARAALGSLPLGFSHRCPQPLCGVPPTAHGSLVLPAGTTGNQPLSLEVS